MCICVVRPIIMVRCIFVIIVTVHIVIPSRIAAFSTILLLFPLIPHRPNIHLPPSILNSNLFPLLPHLAIPPHNTHNHSNLIPPYPPKQIIVTKIHQFPNKSPQNSTYTNYSNQNQYHQNNHNICCHPQEYTVLYYEQIEH